MTDHKTMCECFLCKRQFQFGPHRYAGKYIKAWNIMACETCLKGNWEGIVPAAYSHLVDHLKAHGIPLKLNARGWLDIPNPN